MIPQEKLMVNVLQLNMPFPTPICVYEEIASCIHILLKDNIATTKDKMNTTAGSFSLLKSMLVHANLITVVPYNGQCMIVLDQNSIFWLTFWFSSSPKNSCKHAL